MQKPVRKDPKPRLFVVKYYQAFKRYKIVIEGEKFTADEKYKRVKVVEVVTRLNIEGVET